MDNTKYCKPIKKIKSKYYKMTTKRKAETDANIKDAKNTTKETSWPISDTLEPSRIKVVPKVKEVTSDEVECTTRSFQNPKVKEGPTYF